jgi:superfamily II DNA helicase RecQ
MEVNKYFQLFSNLEVFINMETKKCSMCQEILPKTVEFFATRTDRKNLTYQSNCRKCQSEYRKLHYEKNKQKYIDKAKVFTQSIVEWSIEYKKTLKCVECGENRYWVLDFHHRNPKEKDIEVSTLIRRSSKIKILTEIEKCDVLCSNCHRDLHFRQNNADIA